MAQDVLLLTIMDLSGGTTQAMGIFDQWIAWIYWRRRSVAWVLVQCTRKSVGEGGGERRRPAADDGVEVVNPIVFLRQVDDEGEATGFD